jgi:ABC-type sugar transport system permease subunit
MAEAARSASPAGIGLPSFGNALFVAPYMLLVTGLLFAPLGLGIWLAFQDYDMLGGWAGGVGLENF